MPQTLELSAAAEQALHAYCHNAFVDASGELPTAGTLAPEPSVAVWAGYREAAIEAGSSVWDVLCSRLPQCQFPIAAGISEQPIYRAATRRGELPANPEPPQLERPEALMLDIHPTPAGPIPILTAATRADFVTLVRALLRRNEPAEVPDSMGAVMVAGFNNWDRIARYRADWQRANPLAGAAGWSAAFKALTADRAAYQDRFIILSTGPYSGVSAETLGIDDAAHWQALSLAIRRDHECAHHATIRLFGTMRNHHHDELIADYMGLTAATGRFPADWFLTCLGLEAFPSVRADGRFWNYLGDLPADSDAVGALQALLIRAARRLEQRHDALLDQGEPLESVRDGLFRWLCANRLDQLAD